MDELDLIHTETDLTMTSLRDSIKQKSDIDFDYSYSFLNKITECDESSRKLVLSLALTEEEQLWVESIITKELH